MTSLVSYYLSAPKSNGETEAPSYKPDFIQFTMYIRKVLGLKEGTFFFSLNYISRNKSILYQQEQMLVRLFSENIRHSKKGTSSWAKGSIHRRVRNKSNRKPAGQISA